MGTERSLSSPPCLTSACVTQPKGLANFLSVKLQATSYRIHFAFRECCDCRCVCVAQNPESVILGAKRVVSLCRSQSVFGDKCMHMAGSLMHCVLSLCTESDRLGQTGAKKGSSHV